MEEPRSRGAKKWRSGGVEERMSQGQLTLYLHCCIPSNASRELASSFRSGRLLHSLAPLLLG
jgi:hypothetical protein